MRGITNLLLSTFLALGALIAAGAALNTFGQIERPITGTQSALAISYPEGPSLSVKFKGTERLPKASGEAKVERKKGMTEIEIELDEMKPATYFGGDIATYVLWVVSPEGHTDNVGEFILQGNRSKLNVTTPLETFGMFVTAEPHFLVDVPSRYVVLENTRPTNNLTGKMLDTANIKYRGFDGVYNVTQETLLREPEAKGEIRSDVRQARVSLMLAERAGAEQFAADEYAKAREAWRKTAEAAEANVDKKILMTLGHETVRLAVEAEKRAKERSFQAALDSERKQRADEISSLKTSIEQTQSEAERAKLLARQKEMDLAMEQAARSAAQRQADEAARRAAEAEAKAAQLALAAGTAQQEAEKAKAERDAARARMRDALSAVVEVRETARGLIVNLPDILFDFNQATLKAEAREKLSKVCGILTVAGGYNLSIEGHTDGVGSEEYNQKLSERRAESVKNYLSSCGMTNVAMESKGFGKSQPVATNDTAAGRQQNRRVEIVIADSQAMGRTQ
jgi:outer membrane protein OmpA-like peptidoglycan-associated protein